MDSGHQAVALAGIIGPRVAFPDPLRGVVFEVPGAALLANSGKGLGDSPFNRLVTIADDGEGRVVAADAESGEGRFPGPLGAVRGVH